MFDTINKNIICFISSHIFDEKGLNFNDENNYSDIILLILFMVKNMLKIYHCMIIYILINIIYIQQKIIRIIQINMIYM